MHRPHGESASRDNESKPPQSGLCSLVAEVAAESDTRDEFARGDLPINFITRHNIALLFRGCNATRSRQLYMLNDRAKEKRDAARVCISARLLNAFHTSCNFAYIYATTLTKRKLPRIHGSLSEALFMRSREMPVTVVRFRVKFARDADVEFKSPPLRIVKRPSVSAKKTGCRFFSIHLSLCSPTFQT